MCFYHGGWCPPLRSPSWMPRHPHTTTPPTPPSAKCLRPLVSASAACNWPITIKTNLFSSPPCPTLHNNMFSWLHPTHTLYSTLQALPTKSTLCQVPSSRELKMAIPCTLHIPTPPASRQPSRNPTHIHSSATVFDNIAHWLPTLCSITPFLPNPDKLPTNTDKSSSDTNKPPIVIDFHPHLTDNISFSQTTDNHFS